MIRAEFGKDRRDEVLEAGVVFVLAEVGHRDRRDAGRLVALVLAEAEDGDVAGERVIPHRQETGVARQGVQERSTCRRCTRR